MGIDRHESPITRVFQKKNLAVVGVLSPTTTAILSNNSIWNDAMYKKTMNSTLLEFFLVVGDKTPTTANAL